MRQNNIGRFHCQRDDIRIDPQLLGIDSFDAGSVTVMSTASESAVVPASA
jgi:hypothetical protein